MERVERTFGYDVAFGPEAFAERVPAAQPRRVATIDRVVFGVVVGRTRHHRQWIDAEELSRGRIVGACPHVDEARVGAGVLPVKPEGSGRGACAGGGAVGAVGAFAGHGPC